MVAADPLRGPLNLGVRCEGDCIVGWLTELLKDIPLSALLREKLSVAESKVAALENENTDLQVRLRQQEEKTQHLEKLLKGRSDVLDDSQQKILGLLANGHEFLSEQIVRQLGLGQQLVEFHLLELKESDLIARRAATGMPPRWVIAQEGRRYLNTRGLLTRAKQTST
jgi:hypothetical protein